MFNNILVPTDLSEKSVKAIDIAVRIGSEDNPKITLLHVIETIEDADSEEFGDFYEKLKNRAQKKMAEIAKRYVNEKSKIHKEIAYGKRAAEIVRFAYDHAIDLIILSSHRIDQTNPAEGLATISYKVGIMSHCPVMMVK